VNKESENNILAVLRRIANQYPLSIVAEEVKDISRISFHIHLALETVSQKAVSELALCDLGGGIGLYSVGCAALGFGRVVLIDDFNDPINFEVSNSVLNLHRSHGVEIISHDLVAKGMPPLQGSFDIITTFDSMEHWHHSPKKFFKDAIEKLKPGGAFILGVPNCVNLRKRITVPLGIGKWSSMKDWYEMVEFRGHVREPDVADLRYISQDLGLCDVKIYGRNWMGHVSPHFATRMATKLFDYWLRLKPSLCSNIYLVGRRP